jgi:hypothetical protein
MGSWTTFLPMNRFHKKSIDAGNIKTIKATQQNIYTKSHQQGLAMFQLTDNQ